MGKQIIEGLWDCPYCKTTAIGGLTKHCPACGHPQDEGTRFYMGTAKKYLEADLAAQYGQGADWVCPFCGSLNRVHFQYCANCASPKEASEKDYFSAEKSDESEQPQSKAQTPTNVKPSRRILPLLLIIAILLAGFIALRPRNMQSTVSDMPWERAVEVEAWRTVQESDWSIPDGGRMLRKASEIHHFVSVLDHYETRTRQVSEQVYDGEEIHTSYVNNGDGTFTEETYTTPRYRTEYHTETYQEPIYRQDPIYATKYYYEIERWIVDREERSSGSGGEPYWPQYTRAENEREGQKTESYTLIVTDSKKGRDYTIRLPQERWAAYKTGDAVKITVSMGRVSKLDGEPVS